MVAALSGLWLFPSIATARLALRATLWGFQIRSAEFFERLLGVGPQSIPSACKSRHKTPWPDT